MVEVKSERAINWLVFSDIVVDHIDNYTVRQYGDYPNDQLSDWTPEQCLEAVQRYLNRNLKGTNARGPQETLRDMIKIAHYANVAYEKFQERIDADATSKSNKENRIS